MASGARSKANRNVQKEIDEILKDYPPDKEIETDFICSKINRLSRQRFYDTTRIGALLRQRDDVKRLRTGIWIKVVASA